jgi:H+/Cl- antiporter ClcA
VRRPLRWMVKGFAMLVLMAAILAVVGFIVMWLWNHLIPPLFHGPLLQYPQALGLLILSRLLFGGLRGRGRWHRGHRWRQRWEQLTPEERAQLRERMGRRCGGGRGAPEGPAG